jgi:hypothetical protein
MHELGHLIGLEHIDYAGIMWKSTIDNYSGAMRPCMDDAHGVRAAYPRNAAPSTDLGIYLFHLKDGKWNDPMHPDGIAVGGSLTVNGYTIENVGTVTVAAPKVEWYLCSERNFTARYHYLGTATYPQMVPHFYFFPDTVARSFVVPSMPTGNYYLGAYIRGDQSYTAGTFPFSNSMSFSRLSIAVTAP